MKKEKKKVTITWTFNKPKNEEEWKEQDRILSAGFNIIFEETMRQRAIRKGEKAEEEDLPSKS